MADVLVKPAYIPTQPDTGDATKFGPNAWIAPRLFSAGNDGEIIVRRVASATGAAWEVPVAGAAAAGTLTGNTLAANVLSSFLTSVGTLASLTVTAPITGSVTGAAGSAPAGTLTGATLAANVLASSLTSLGTLANLTVTNPIVGSLTAGTPPWIVDGRSGQTFNSVFDPMLLIGSNISVGAIRPNTSDAAIWMQMEHDWYDTVNHFSEVNINTLSTTGTNRRHYGLTVDRANPDVYSRHTFWIDPVGGRFRIWDVSDPTVANSAKCYHDFQPARYVITGSAAPEINWLATSGATPSKSLRLNAGKLQVVNAAYSTVILDLTDTGDLTVPGSIFTAVSVGLTSNLAQVAFNAAVANDVLIRGSRLQISNSANSIGSIVKVDALPTVTAGGGTSPVVTAGSTPFAGSVNVGSGAPGATITITFGGTAFPSAPFPVCMNLTTGLAVKATATATTLVITPATGNFGASDVIAWHCISSK